tara:strand:- start:574 stop:813 length:240 start_codon:yes stop_codon:yes gene_type:complete
LSGNYKKGDLLYNSYIQKFCIFLEYFVDTSRKHSTTLSKVIIDEKVSISNPLFLYKVYDKVIELDNGENLKRKYNDTKI